MPSAHFAANGAWAICAAITHNLLWDSPKIVKGSLCRCWLVSGDLFKLGGR